MQRPTLLLALTTALLLLSAGCLSADPSPSEDAGVLLITPGTEIPFLDGPGVSSMITGTETTLPLPVPLNYSLETITLPPGTATPPYRLSNSSACLYLIGGEAEIRCDTTTVNASEGEIVLLPAGAKQSIAAAGDTELRYLAAMQPPNPSVILIPEDETGAPAGTTGCVPIVIADPRNGIEWDIGSDMMIYTLVNPVLLPEMNAPVGYSLAFAELLPGGSVGFNRLVGASEVIYVISGEIEVFTPDGSVTRVPAGSAAYVAPDRVKGYRNSAALTSTILSFVDPAWTPERTEMLA